MGGNSIPGTDGQKQITSNRLEHVSSVHVYKPPFPDKKQRVVYLFQASTEESWERLGQSPETRRKLQTEKKKKKCSPGFPFI